MVMKLERSLIASWRYFSRRNDKNTPDKKGKDEQRIGKPKFPTGFELGESFSRLERRITLKFLPHPLILFLIFPGFPSSSFSFLFSFYSFFPRIQFLLPYPPPASDKNYLRQEENEILAERIQIFRSLYQQTNQIPILMWSSEEKMS